MMDMNNERKNGERISWKEIDEKVCKNKDNENNKEGVMDNDRNMEGERRKNNENECQGVSSCRKCNF